MLWGWGLPPRQLGVPRAGKAGLQSTQVPPSEGPAAPSIGSSPCSGSQGPQGCSAPAGPHSPQPPCCHAPRCLLHTAETALVRAAASDVPNGSCLLDSPWAPGQQGWVPGTVLSPTNMWLQGGSSGLSGWPGARSPCGAGASRATRPRALPPALWGLSPQTHHPAPALGLSCPAAGFMFNLRGVCCPPGDSRGSRDVGFLLAPCYRHSEALVPMPPPVHDPISPDVWCLLLGPDPSCAPGSTHSLQTPPCGSEPAAMLWAEHRPQPRMRRGPGVLG